jgi:hypothetical protein
MDEIEMKARVRAIEQMAQGGDPDCFVVFQVWSGHRQHFRLCLHWSKRPDMSFVGETAAEAIGQAEAMFGAAVREWAIL